MKTRCTLALVLIGFATPAFAHRLDEYLQATLVNVAADHIDLNMRLTPGIEVLDKLLAVIDTDGDGAISPREQQTYAEAVRRDLTLTLDGATLPLRLIRLSYPTLAEMRQGLGEIALGFEAEVATPGERRVLVFQNRHQAALSVYLVNCLLPSDPTIRVSAQHRNYDQSFYQLDYRHGETVANLPSTDPPSSHDGWLDTSGNKSLFTAFFYQGVRHILTGYDHLLFVGALVLAATTLWDLIKVVSAFTLAHTITMTLAAMDLIHAPVWLVEPLIAASVVCVAAQNVFWPRQAHGWSRLAVAFFFGLFHGLGFAGGMLEAMHDMQGSTMLLAILAFGLGVETGHQVIVLPLFVLLKLIRQAQPDVVARTQLSMAFQRVGSAAISLAGIYYFGLALADRLPP